jgi:hypothetical protein
METVKAHETKLVTARELFSMSYATRELFTDKKIESMKKSIIEKKKLEMVSVEFFENEGIIFYSESKEKDLTTIEYLKDYTITNGELWRFGFVNRKTGQITLLFGGHCVAKGHKEAIKYFEIAKVVTNNRFGFENPADLIPFAHKD